MSMQDDYSWNGGSRGASSYRLPENEGQGRWVVIALFMAVILHVVAFWALGRIDVLMPDSDESDLVTEIVRVSPVDLDDYRPEVSAPESEDVAEPVAEVPPFEELDELDILENLPDMDIDIVADLDTLEIPDISSAAAGELDGEMMEPMKAPNLEPDLPDMGKTEDFLPRANDTQVMVDPGARMAEEYDPDAFTEELRKGAEGEAEDGLLKEFSSLDQMANMDGNSLLSSKALIGSDLLFEFNSSELRQSARVSLMKVALLIHKHPNLICWVDGHTDLIGRDAPNMKLSEERAMAVKRWLVNSMELDEGRIAVRGFGKQNPIVKSGTADQQAPNRRVEIKMRKSMPKDAVAYRKDRLPATREKFSTKEADAPSKVAPEKPPVKAVLVKPLRKIPNAIPVAEEVDPAPRALIVAEDPPRAVVIPEDGHDSSRAVPVDE